MLPAGGEGASVDTSDVQHLHALVAAALVRHATVHLGYSVVDGTPGVKVVPIHGSPSSATTQPPIDQMVKYNLLPSSITIDTTHHVTVAVSGCRMGLTLGSRGLGSQTHLY